MTLITAVLTDEYVVMASDRRVTWRHGTRTERFEDSAMKCFVLGGHLLMGFTGVAVIEGKSMELWLGETISRVDTADMIGELQKRIQEVFDRTPSLSGQPHSFFAAGFLRRRPDGKFIPVGILLSNCMNRAGVPDPRRVNGTFLGRKMRLGNQRHHVLTIGWDVPEVERQSLDRQVRIALKANSRDPLLIAGPVIEMMRRVAGKSRGGVGESILFSSMPRVSVPIDGWALPIAGMKPDSANTPMALYFEKNTLDPDSALIYLPAMYWKGSAAAGIEIRQLEPSTDDERGVPWSRDR
ncbi:hypothetical protein AB1285_02110 [Microbacterium sp. NRRL B-14842]|uniref:hypothetical protein n=1 Tax=Microbacterium sp. NRRL B-14842 TaxID=3162881 RepID=UPI00351508A9